MKTMQKHQRGVTVMMVVAFMGIFLLIMGTITSYAFEQAKYGRALYDREQALHAAEAGLEYYRWYLAHNPDDLTNGTGLPGPYTYSVKDPEGSEVGQASLSVVGNSQCGVVQSIDIASTGSSDLDPAYKRTIAVRYMRPSAAAYSYLLNTNVWAGSDRQITGPYFSNGGIRMDGTNNSDVSSAVSTWYCDSNYNCSPTQSKAPGVLGSGTGYALWHYPEASIDFTGITVSLASLKTYAQNGGGRYFSPASGSVNSRGYHLIFKSDGTFDVYRVTGTTGVYAYSSDVGNYFKEYSIISSQTYVGNYSIPSDCGLVFVEDRAWIEGVVHGKVTVIAATPSSSATAPQIYLSGNITYTKQDGSDGLTAIAESDVLIPLNSPDSMELHGIFVAQGGHYGRNYYTNSGSYRVPSQYSGYVLRTSLLTEGSVVSDTRTGTAWSSGGSTISGYENRTDAYDELQATDPPPFTPSASSDYTFVRWSEQ